MTPKKTYTIDASEKILGRLSSEIAFLLQGKNFPSYVPYLDSAVEVIVINTSRLKVTGKKNEQKKYYRHSGYPGGIKEVAYKDVFSRDPNEVLRKAVYGMLPGNKLRVKMMRRLKLYKKGQHDKD